MGWIPPLFLGDLQGPPAERAVKLYLTLSFPWYKIKIMKRCAELFVIVLLAASCGWFSSSPVPGDGDLDGDELEVWPGCRSDDDCDDNEPCNGVETCVEGQCREGISLEDGTPCTSPLGAEGLCMEDLCIPLTCGNGIVEELEECDDVNEVSGDGCERNCLFSCHQNDDCDDSNVCTVDLCNTGGNGKICEYEPRAGPCDDGLFCTRDDQCNDMGECSGIEDVCEDDYACTGDICDEASDSCSNPVTSGWCLINGTCYEDGETNPDNPCEECSSASSSSAWSYAAAGSACSDGYSCTDDACDGSGSCTGVPNDANCGYGEICRPECFSSGGSGCGMPPESMELTCDAPAPGDAAATCHIALDGLDGQATCLTCRSEVGVVALDFTDFGDSLGTCDMNGWELITSSECCESIDGCAPSSCTMPCCDRLDEICRREMETWLIRQSERRCDAEETRLHKTFDTTGIGALTLCFDLAYDRTEVFDGVLVYVSDETHSPEQVFCLMGDAHPDIDGTLYKFCVDLPSWTENNPAVAVKFVLHTNVSWAYIFLDNIGLKGWVSGCAPNTQTIFTEDFTGCSLTIPDGWNGWQAISNPRCNGSWHCPSPSTVPAAFANDEWWALARTVDTTALGGDVTLCFRAGDYNSGDHIEVMIDTDGAGSWEGAWYERGSIGPDGECREICVTLSDINPDANRNPFLGLQFEVNSNWSVYDNGYYMLDDISVAGAVFCDGAGIADVGAITETADGFYEFSVSNMTGGMMSPWIHCSWDSPASPVEASTTIHFTN